VVPPTYFQNSVQRTIVYANSSVCQQHAWYSNLLLQAVDRLSYNSINFEIAW